MIFSNVSPINFIGGLRHVLKYTSLFFLLKDVNFGRAAQFNDFRNFSTALRNLLNNFFSQFFDQVPLALAFNCRRIFGAKFECTGNGGTYLGFFGCPVDYEVPFSLSAGMRHACPHVILAPLLLDIYIQT